MRPIYCNKTSLYRVEPMCKANFVKNGHGIVGLAAKHPVPQCRRHYYTQMHCLEDSLKKEVKWWPFITSMDSYEAQITTLRTDAFSREFALQCLRIRILQPYPISVRE